MQLIHDVLVWSSWSSAVAAMRQFTAHSWRQLLASDCLILTLQFEFISFKASLLPPSESLRLYRRAYSDGPASDNQWTCPCLDIQLQQPTRALSVCLSVWMIYSDHHACTTQPIIIASVLYTSLCLCLCVGRWSDVYLYHVCIDVNCYFRDICEVMSCAAYADISAVINYTPSLSPLPTSTDNVWWTFIVWLWGRL